MAATETAATDTQEFVFEPLKISNAKIKVPRPNGYPHSQLQNINGKTVHFKNVDFSYAMMDRCYFHKAVFERCNFTGARFKDCNFRGAEFISCKFDYCVFDTTFLHADQIINSLPSAPNIKQELLQILRSNAHSIGDVKSLPILTREEIRAEKEHLRRAWRQDEQYYKDKYNTRISRLRVGLRRAFLFVDGAIWGHGERWWSIAISSLGFVMLLSAIYTYFSSDFHGGMPLLQLYNSFLSNLFYTTNLFIDVPVDSRPDRIIFIDWIIVIGRYIFVGLLISVIFRSYSKR